MHVLRLIMILAGAVLAFGGTAAVLAQDAPLTANSFDTPFTPAPELCTITPLSTDEAAATLATPSPLPEWPITDGGIIALPSGTPADQATVDGVLASITQFWACNNAQNMAALLAVFSDEGLQMTLGVTEESAYSYEEIRAAVAAEMTPSDPRPEEEWASIDAVISVLSEADGSVGVLILNSDPNVNEGDQVLDYFNFVQGDAGWQLSRVILDPFDLADDYGYDWAPEE